MKRSHRRKVQKRKPVRRAYVPESFLDALREQIPGFASRPDRIQFHLALMIWESDQKRREHSTRSGYISFSYRELDRRFGRRGFSKINSELNIFEVTPNWFGYSARISVEKSTKGYRLTPYVREVLERYLQLKPETVTRLLYLDRCGLKVLRSLPEAISSKEYDEPSGITAKAWREARPLNRIPVDIEGLLDLDGVIRSKLHSGRISCTFIRTKLQLHLRWAGAIIQLAHVDVAGRGFVMHRYAEHRTGRLYATGPSLQTAPKIVRRAALHGLYDYDIANCHFAIFEQLCTRYGYEAEAIRRYLLNKEAIRAGIAERTGISIAQAKKCLVSLMYGATQSERSQNAIPKEIGAARARILFTDPVFSALAEDVKQGRAVILSSWPKKGNRLFNVLGKPIALSEKPAAILAHILQGIEAMCIKAAIDLYPEDIVLLMHDGFVTNRQIDIRRVEQQMHEVTGFLLSMEEEEIPAPSEMDLS